MKSKKLSNFLRDYATYKKITSLFMALLLLCCVGCSSSGGNNKDNSSQISSVQSDSSADASSEDVSSDENVSSELQSSNVSSGTSSQSKIDYADGEITFEQGIEYTAIASDDDKYELLVNPSGLAYGYEGYADKEADAMRKKILNTPNTEKFYKLKGNIYYVSSKGNDNNDGKSPKTPIKSLGAISNLDLKYGDAVLFERGSVFRIFEMFTTPAGITYGSYGEGRKPMFLGSPENFANKIWKPSNKKNVWYTSYLYAAPCGAFFDQGKEIGFLKYTMRSLKKNTDFYCDSETGKFYVYCDKGNPADVWDSIEIIQDGCYFRCMGNVDDVVFDNLCLRYTASGFSMIYDNDGVSVTNCEVGYTGGMLFKSGARAGNGIGWWCGGYDCKVENNWVYQTFDSGISPQGNLGPRKNYDNISICNNLLEYNNADIEVWEHGNADGKFTRFKNLKMDNNIMRFTALGWGTRLDDGGIRGIEGVLYGYCEENEWIDVSFSNNIIDCPARKIIDFTINTKKQSDGITRKNNVFYVKNSLRTTALITRGVSYYNDGILAHEANKGEAVTIAIHKFDPTAKVYWYK